MELTKYQKSYLWEYEWNIHNASHDANMAGSGENSCWLQLNKEDGLVFEEAKKQLKYGDSCENIKVLIVASRGSKRTCRCHPGDRRTGGYG